MVGDGWPAPSRRRSARGHTTGHRLRPRRGDLLLVPAGSGPREADVLCVIDDDTSEPGAVFTLVLNQPTNRPARPLAFLPFDPGETCAWWGGPTTEAFALVELQAREGPDDLLRPDGTPRPYLTERTGLWTPGRDHPPSSPARARVFVGSVWLSAEQTTSTPDKGTSCQPKTTGYSTSNHAPWHTDCAP